MIGEISLSTPLPPTWLMARLKDVASVRYGKALATDNREKTGKIPVFGSSTTTGFHDAAFHEKPSIVIGRKGSVGSLQYVDVPFWPIDTVFFLDNVSPYIDLRFLAAALSHFGLERFKIVVGVPGINRSDLESFQFPLPPLSEQQRIVEILQEAEEIRRLCAEAKAKTAELAPAMFDAIFGTPSEWKGGPKLGELVKIVGGGTPSRSMEHYYSGKIPWATPKDIKKLYLDDTEEHVTEEAVLSSATNVVPKESVLVVVKSKILAHTLPIAITKAPMCFGQDIKGMIPTTGIAPEFLVYSLQAQLSRILSRARGANTEGLTLEALKTLDMPKTSPGLIERFQNACKQIRSLREASLASIRMGCLTSASLSAHAFSGQLTADWREAHQDQLSTESRARDVALKKPIGIISHTRTLTIKDYDVLLNFRHGGIYSDLNREQLLLLKVIRMHVRRVGQVWYFSAKSLSDSLTGPLHKNPQAIEGHLAVFAARGIIIPVSREKQTEDTGDFVFGNAYRLPLDDFEPGEGEDGEPRIGDHVRLRELERLAAQLAKERTQT